jgi:ABC-type transporter Mla maintaining outer membrane lipid asymmetry ATPase subunit MlaF
MAQETPSSAPLLEVEAADVCFRGSPHLVRVAGVDWRVAPGEYWVVGGPAESGKTELLEMAAGLHRPGRGVVRLFGQDLSELPEPQLLKQRARIGFVFKSGMHVFSDLTVAENIALPLRYHQNLTAERALSTVHELLQLTELGDIGSKSPQILGTSMGLRVDLARALALKPEILFLDEPLAGMSRRHRQWWLDFLRALVSGLPFMGGKKAAVVITTNDFSAWQGRPVRFAQIRDKQWRILGEMAEAPVL